MTKIHNVA